MKNKHTNQLLQMLVQFGLDPAEWLIDNSVQGFFDTLLLTHKQDPEFRLLGHLGPKGWKNLQLLSI